MSVDYGSIIAALQQFNPSIAGVCVTSMMGKILYVSQGWQPDPSEIQRAVSAWTGGSAIAVTISGVKFSVLQSSPERFISTNIKKQGHLVGAKTPSGECVLGFVLPDGAYDGAYMDLARAAGEMRQGGSAQNLTMTQKTSDTVYQKTDVSGARLQANPTPTGGGAAGPDAQDVQQLLEWINKTDGLVAYIQYCLQNNDANRIGAFARFYRSLRQALG
ncbi:hypothetical protein GF325_17375 [Candidatus Bathyarchaeota archaeon]|nr:hypothetical protein [Candidatus Bathyarchaeota archaeon]